MNGSTMFPTTPRHSITIKIEPEDDDVPVVVRVTEMSPPPDPLPLPDENPVINTAAELHQYFESVPKVLAVGSYRCPFNGCRIKRYLHFKEHLFGRHNRIAVCGPLRPASSKKRRIKTEEAEAAVELNQSHQSAMQSQALFPQQQQLVHQVRSPPKKRQSLVSRLLASPSPHNDNNHIIDEPINLSQSHASGSQDQLNGHHEEESSAQFVRRSTRVKKEPVDVYEAEIPASVLRKSHGKGKKKKSASHRNSAASVPLVTLSPVATSASSSVRTTILMNAGTQTDLTIFQMSFMNIKDKKKKNNNHND
jgi:hypothetical protein